MKKQYLFLVPILLITSCHAEPAPTSFMVTFNANGGVFNNGNNKIEVKVDAGENVEPPKELPEHPNDLFFGKWFDNEACVGEPFSFSTPINQNLTLYARWLENTGVDTDWDGLVDDIDPAPNDNQYVANELEIYPPIHEVNMPISVDYTHFLIDETIFSHDLEKLGVVCAMDIYKESTTTLVGASSIYKPYAGDDDEELYKQMGCTDITKYIFNPDEYLIDKFDTYTCLLAHHYFVKDNEAYEVLFVTNQGTDSEAEWYSDFDVGNDNDDYARVTGIEKGRHTDWLNNGANNTPTHHKGFDVAVNRQFNKVIKPYIDENINKQAKLIIFNTGHSRGAAIANLLGKKFNDNKSNLNIYKCFTYTYATPTTIYTNNDENVACPGVFNILNSDDLVPELPLREWQYHRYGIDKPYRVSNHKEAWQEYNDTIFPYESPDINKLTASMLNMSPNRDQIYNEQKTPETLFANEKFANKEQRDIKKNEWMEKGKLWYGEKTIDFDLTNDLELKAYNRPASLMNRLAVVLGCVNAGNMTRLVQIIGDKMLANNYKDIEDNFLNNGASLLTAHRGTTYYFISSELIEK